MSLTTFSLCTNNARLILTSSWAVPFPLLFLLQSPLVVLLGCSPRVYTRAEVIMLNLNSCSYGHLLKNGHFPLLCPQLPTTLNKYFWTKETNAQLKTFSLIQICMWISEITRDIKILICPSTSRGLETHALKIYHENVSLASEDPWGNWKKQL